MKNISLHTFFQKIALVCLLLVPMAAAAQIMSSYYEYDKQQNGEYGYLFHAQLQVQGMQGVQTNVTIFIYDEDGNTVPASVSNGYQSQDGSLCTWDNVTPSYASTMWNDFKLFIPYSAMKNMKRGKTYTFAWFVRDMSNGYNVIASSDYYTFEEWEVHKGSLDSIQVRSTTKNDQKGFQISGKLSISGNIGTDYEVQVQFYDQDKKAVPGRVNGYMTSGSNSVAATWVNGLCPPYIHSQWTDRITLFMPNNALGFEANKQYYYKYWIRKKGDNSEKLFVSEYLPLNTVKNYEKAKVTWLSSTDPQSSKSYNFRAGVKSASQIMSTSLTLNGQACRGFKVVDDDGYDMNVNQTIQLAEGQNTIRLTVVNEGGETVVEKNIVYHSSAVVVENPQKRLALVIGNGAYPTQSLANPVNDATDVANKLKSLGFDVILLTDANKRQMEEKIQEFGQKASGYEVALFFYAGHGIQYNGRNYLIPVNVTLNSPSDIEYDCTEANRVLSKMEEAKCQTNIVVLDACRNNPFERSWSRGVGDHGLSSMDAPRGSLIAYATSPGNVAQDGKTRNSPYTAAFLSALDIPGMSIYEFFPYVSGLVQEATGNSQVPWISSSVSGKFYFNYSK